MKKTKAYVLIPVHNRADLTKKVLQCLAQQTISDFDTIVIDDGSTDGTAEMLRREFPTVKVLCGDGSLFWTGAVNLGLRHILQEADENDIVLLLNDDLEFDDKYVYTVLELTKKHTNTLIGSVVVDMEQPDIIFDGGCRINWWTAKYTYVNQHRSLSSLPKGAIFPVSTLTGRGVAIPIRVFRRTGLYDHARFQHRGDFELPVRANRLGYDLLVCYDAVVKCHTRTTYKLHESGRYHLADIWNFLFDFRSYGSLQFRYRFAKQMTKGPVQFLSFLSLDLARLGCHFVRRLDFGPSHKSD